MEYKKDLEEVISVLFFNLWQPSNLLKTANTINENMGVFDGQPLVLPIDTSDAPPQVPRIILKNKDESVRLEISLEKAVLVISKDIEGKFKISNELIGCLIHIIYDEFEWEVNRLAKVSKYKLILENNSIEYIQEKYLKDNVIKKPGQLNLHWLKKILYNEDKLNHWVKINTLEGYENKEFKLTVDINMIQDNDRIVDDELAISFFKDIDERIEESFIEVVS
jgi:hypothetical protein